LVNKKMSNNNSKITINGIGFKEFLIFGILYLEYKKKKKLYIIYE